MPAELRDQVQASLGSNFTLERELGGGGMSRVFLARDVGLDRAIVVKVLSDEFTTGVSADRFRREIQLIARLQHPHVVPILSAGVSDGGLYYTMPFFGGETLRARLAREGPMPIAQATRILREVLDALSFAHSHGVIHRDIKPENILLEAGHAVVADFGIAKALKESGSLTSTGMAVGTPAYMAPEQATADPTADHRADLYAVGVIAYEMLSGAPPFVGTAQQMVRAHMIEPPPPLLQRRPDAPAQLAQMVMQALEKDPAQRPQSAAEMLVTLDAFTTPTATIPIGVAAASRRKPQGPIIAAAAGLLLVVGGFTAWRMSRPPVIAGARSIAIAPFSVASGDTALARLGQNLVTTISANLDGVGDIRVADPMAVLSNAKSVGSLIAAADAMNIARRLGAKSVVHGTLAPAGPNVRADAVLLNVAQGEQLARISVTAPAGDIAALTDSLTWALLRAVWSKGRAPTPTVSGITTHSQTSLREFLDGERLFGRGDILGGADAYKRAVNADTTFWFAHYRYRIARGWVGLPIDTAIASRLRRHIGDLPERERALVSATDSAYGVITPRIAAYRRLVEQYPDYAPAWVTLGDYLIHHAMPAGHQVSEAIGPWQQAVRLMPNDEESANHLVFACIAADDTTCIRPAFAHLDSLVRADSAPSQVARYAHRLLIQVLSPARRTLTDSMLTVARRDSVFPLGIYVFRQMFAGATAMNPGLTAEWDYLESRATAGAAFIPIEAVGLDHNIHNASRGDFSGIDAAIRTPGVSPGLVSSMPLRAVRVRALGELQGLVAPAIITSSAALEVAKRPGTSTAVRYDAWWIDGLSSMLRNDKTHFDERMRALQADTSRLAKFAVRSLRAIAAYRGGQTKAAAESLLVLERDHGESTSRVWSALAADRLLASQWLADQKRWAEADSLLYFTRGYAFGNIGEAGETIFAPAQLIRSRAAEGMGNNVAAVRFAQVFLNSFDKAPASQKPILDEARNRIARLNPGDKPRPSR